MRQVMLAAFTLLLMAAAGVPAAETPNASDTAPTTQAKPNAPRPLPKGEWLDPNHDAPNGTQYKTFTSKVLGRDVSYLVYLPPGYEEGTARYPVIYWLHGHGGNQRAGALMFVPHLDAAIKADVLPPVIAVCVNGMGWGSYVDLPNGSRPIESVIIKDLIPHIDQTYRTNPMREGRMIEGFSMGGFGAGHLGFKYPELFGTVVINSGALADATWRKSEEHPRELARKNAEALRKTHIRIGCGSLDDLLPKNQELHDVLTQLKIKHDFEVVPDVAHNSALYYEKLGTKVFEFHRKSLEDLAKDQ